MTLNSQETQKIIEETHLSLSLLGQVLIQAGREVEIVLRAETAGPLSKSLQTVENIVEIIHTP